MGDACKFDEAEDGIIAIRKYVEAMDHGSPFDIILMDIIMPEMDGKPAIKEIRKIEMGSGRDRTPIHLVTASEMLGDVEDLVCGLENRQQVH